MSRELVYKLLTETPVPKNYRWKLEHKDNVLFLIVSRRMPMELKLFGRVWWSRENGWEDLREIQAPNYASLLAQLENWPEFLEFQRQGTCTADVGSLLRISVSESLLKETRPGGLLHQ